MCWATVCCSHSAHFVRRHYGRYEMMAMTIIAFIEDPQDVKFMFTFRVQSGI